MVTYLKYPARNTVIYNSIHWYLLEIYIKNLQKITPFLCGLSPGTRSSFQFKKRIFPFSQKIFLDRVSRFSIDFSKSRSYFLSNEKIFYGSFLDRSFKIQNVIFL
uniref:Uncharacterized protein n=1 Tax=Salmonella phage vB_SEnST11_KE23 TaxID=3161174 RepID=A0AAU8GG36_9CAUD